MTRPVLIYGAEAWSLRRKDEKMLEEQNENVALDTWDLFEEQEKK